MAALINGLTALKMMHITWIRFERTYNTAFFRRASSATPHFYVMLPNLKKLFPGENPLNQAALAINNLTADFFKDSSWYSYWRVKTRNGAEVSRSLFFDVKIVPKELLVQGINLFNFIHSWGGTALSSYNRRGTLELSTKTLLPR